MSRKSKTPWVSEVEPEAPYHPSAKLATLHIKPRNTNQKLYLEAIDAHDMTFGIGPAGTGKTYLAVAKAVQWLAKKGNKLILARPAVEAGENLGFLPGNAQEKVDPYLRPLYDALYDLMDPEKVDRYFEMGIIEIAPVAFLRGRTLDKAFIIIDEAQNTTVKQMEMLLTRMGPSSKIVVTGDITQIDLPYTLSGLLDAMKVLSRVDDIHFHYFEEDDVVRHELVKKVVLAYRAEREKRNAGNIQECSKETSRKN